MAAAPQYGALIFQGSRTYQVDMYASDVANAPLRFDEGAGASSSSQTFWTPPEPVVLVDVFIHTGMTDTTRVRLTANGSPLQTIIRYAAALDTSNARAKLSLGFNAGTRVGGIQLA